MVVDNEIVPNSLIDDYGPGQAETLTLNNLIVASQFAVRTGGDTGGATLKVTGIALNFWPEFRDFGCP